MAFMLGKHLVFFDSFQLMASSLDRLAANLPKDKFKYTSQVFHNEELTLMQKKDVYPYDFMDSFSKFNHPPLPTKDEFFSMLTNEGISDKQYNHAQQVWNKFVFYPETEYDNESKVRIFNDLMACAMRKNDDNTGTQLNLANYNSLFPLIYFDLTYQTGKVTRDLKQLISRYRLSANANQNFAVHNVVMKRS